MGVALIFGLQMSINSHSLPQVKDSCGCLMAILNSGNKVGGTLCDSKHCFAACFQSGKDLELGI